MEGLTAEQRRKQNIADNRRILAEIGLTNPFKEELKLTLKKSQLKRKAEHQLNRPKKRSFLEDVHNVNRGSIMGKRRRSARLQGSTPSSEGLPMDFEDNDDEEEEREKFRPVEKNRPNFYGPIPGIEVGASWLTRMECSRDGVHRPTVAGIHGGQEGAYSIALSGGYDDNVDYGECFTYTGEGGRDLKGTASNPKNLRMAPQSKNQTLSRGNLALHTSVETGNPVRVIRGYKLSTVFAPEEGYRYDGLYTVKKAWYTTGQSGFKVWKFALKRLSDQDSPPWEFTLQFEERPTKEPKDNDEPEDDDENDENEHEDTEDLNEAELDDENDDADKENMGVDKCNLTKERHVDPANEKDDLNRDRPNDSPKVSEKLESSENKCDDLKESVGIMKEINNDKSNEVVTHSETNVEKEKISINEENNNKATSENKTNTDHCEPSDKLESGN